MSHQALEQEIEELSQEILERYEEVNILYRLVDSFSDVFDERKIMDRLLSEAAGSVHATGGWIAVINGEGKLGEKVCFGESVEIDGSVPSRALEVAERSMAENRTLSLECGTSLQDAEVPMMSVPLPGKTAPMGALVLERFANADPFRSGDLRLVTAVASVGAGVIENRRLALEMKRAELVRGEIEIARRIQQGLLPSEDPRVPGLDVAGICRPAQDIGGDYFGYSHVGPGRFGITIADVSGHSIGAAIGMVMARCLIQSEAHQSASPAHIASRVNELLNRDLTDPGMFVTAFLTVYEEETGRLHYTNAGHNPPLLYRAAMGTIAPLRGGSLGLGILPGTRYYDRVETLRAGDVLVLYTDGLTETRSGAGEMFGLDRLKKTVLACRHMGARDAVAAIVRQVVQWRVVADFVDDITLVVAKKT